jgi:hypothetical protein
VLRQWQYPRAVERGGHHSHHQPVLTKPPQRVEERMSSSTMPYDQFSLRDISTRRDTALGIGRVGTGTAPVSPARVPPIAATVSMEQAEKGVHEAPTMETVQAEPLHVPAPASTMGRTGVGASEMSAVDLAAG